MKLSEAIIILTFIFLCTSALRGQQTSDIQFNRLDEMLIKEFGDEFGYSVLVYDEKSILFEKSFGKIDSLRTKTPDAQTLFNIASVSKSFTAIGIMRLIEQNKIRLNDTIGVFFDNVPIDKKSITISHLLCHKSHLHLLEKTATAYTVSVTFSLLPACLRRML